MTPTPEEWKRLSEKVDELAKFIDKLRNLQWIVLILVAVFGVNAATTWTHLTKARSESEALEKTVEQRVHEAQEAVTRHADSLTAGLASKAVARMEIVAEPQPSCELVTNGRTNVGGDSSVVTYGKTDNAGRECWLYKRLKLVSK